MITDSAHSKSHDQTNWDRNKHYTLVLPAPNPFTRHCSTPPWGQVDENLTMLLLSQALGIYVYLPPHEKSLIQIKVWVLSLFLMYSCQGLVLGTFCIFPCKPRPSLAKTNRELGKKLLRQVKNCLQQATQRHLGIDTRSLIHQSRSLLLSFPSD